MKLDLGSGNPSEGEVQPEGYTLNDVHPHPNIDIVCNILDLTNHLKPGSCDKIRASHVLEHFSRKELSKVLNIIHTLLKDGGEVEIIVPNLTYHFQLLIEGKEEEAITYMYGGQLDEYDFHKNGFTRSTLAKTVTKHGFRVTGILERASLVCNAVK